MLSKRASAESNNDQQTNDGLELSVFQPDDNAERAKPASLSDTTLQNLPIELLERILLRVIAMEVDDMKLAKSVWKEKSGFVINRLRSVCSQWNSFLATDFFQNAVDRTLDRMAQEIRMEILHQSPMQLHVFKVTSLKDEIFMHSRKDDILVYDRNNMAEMKDAIPVPGILPVDLAACIISNCVYVLGPGLNTESHGLSVLRITKNAENQFSISPWISDVRLSFSILSTSANGNLIILSNQQGSNPAVLSIYNVNGSMQHKIMLSSGLYDFRHGGNVLQKSDGNLVLVSHNDQLKTQLTEITTSGSIVRQYQSTLGEDCAVNFADVYGRIIISEPSNRIELLDSELNPMNFTGAQLDEGQFSSPHILHYNSENNEIVGIYSQNYHDSVLTIFRFTEE